VTNASLIVLLNAKLVLMDMRLIKICVSRMFVMLKTVRLVEQIPVLVQAVKVGIGYKTEPAKNVMLEAVKTVIQALISVIHVFETILCLRIKRAVKTTDVSLGGNSYPQIEYVELSLILY